MSKVLRRNSKSTPVRATTATGDTRAKMLCNHFARGACTKGKDCPYLHDRKAAAKAKAKAPANPNKEKEKEKFNKDKENGGADDKGKNKGKNNPSPTSRIPCRNYANGQCKFGDSCQYLHDKANVTVPASAAFDVSFGMACVELDKAEGTLKGAANLLKKNPYPPLHLARLYGKKEEKDAEKEQIDSALEIDPGCVDAWAYLFQTVRDAKDEDAAVAAVEEKAKGQKNAAPYVAIQGFFAGKDETRPKAIEFAKKGVEANSDDPIALLCLSALHGQNGDLESVIGLLSKHEAKMSSNVHLANNYFEALFQTRQIEKVTKLLNALAGSPNKEVKTFAIQRSQAVAQFLQQQQQRLAGANANKA